jgi:cytochrome c biogenesis protein ResB
MTSGAGDPIRAKRARIAALVGLGKRIGYSLFGIAIVAFVIGFVTDFGSPVGPIIVGCLVVGSIVLAPAIVFGYGVKAGERDDRARGF